MAGGMSDGAGGRGVSQKTQGLAAREAGLVSKSGSVLVPGDLARALTCAGPQLHSRCSEQYEQVKR